MSAIKIRHSGLAPVPAFAFNPDCPLEMKNQSLHRRSSIHRAIDLYNNRAASCAPTSMPSFDQKSKWANEKFGFNLAFADVI